MHLDDCLRCNLTWPISVDDGGDCCAALHSSWQDHGRLGDMTTAQHCPKEALLSACLLLICAERRPCARLFINA